MEGTCTKVGACTRSGSAADRAAERGPLRIRFEVAMVHAGGVDGAPSAGSVEHTGCVSATKDLPTERVAEG